MSTKDQEPLFIMGLSFALNGPEKDAIRKVCREAQRRLELAKADVWPDAVKYKENQQKDISTLIRMLGSVYKDYRKLNEE